jgi:hypothetical protein
MIFANAAMNAYLSDGGDLPTLPLSDELAEILRNGVVEFNGAWLLVREVNERTRAELDLGVRDFAYFEYSKNKFHVEDECVGDVFLMALSFLAQFSEDWRLMGGVSCDAVVAFQIGDEAPDGAIFTFYARREGESPVIDVEALEEFSQPIAIVRI